MATELLGLHNLPLNKKSRHVNLRRGRGDSAGQGSYSGRGIKGQKSRTGGSNGLQFKGLRNYLLRIPKSRGFRSAQPKYFPINLDLLNKYFKDDELVSLKSLTRHGLISKGEKNVKILGKGKLTKKLKVKIDNVSAGARAAIEKNGGTVEVKKNKDVEIKDAK